MVEVGDGDFRPTRCSGTCSNSRRRWGGRARRRKGPASIDLDLLLFGDEEWNTPELTMPHPALAERDFVVTPLLEIAPRTTLPDGTPLRRSQATVGPVLRDLGSVPDAGIEHNVPVEDVEWVTVAQSESASDTTAQASTPALRLKQEVLESEGIPFAYTPYEPGTDMDPFGMQVTFQLLVPEEYAQTAQGAAGPRGRRPSRSTRPATARTRRRRRSRPTRILRRSERLAVLYSHSLTGGPRGPRMGLRRRTAKETP